MADDTKSATYLNERLEDHELLAIRNRWTARGSAAARSPEEFAELLAEAQRDIGKLLRHLDAFGGPPVIDQ
jgi:hypothetical protein